MRAVTLLSVRPGGWLVLLTLLLWANGAVIAQKTNPPGAAPSGPEQAPLGTGRGATRQAWAAAAALSRGISVPTLLDSSPGAASAAARTGRLADTIAQAGFRSVHLPVTWPANSPLPATWQGERTDAAGDPPFSRQLDAVVDGFLARGLSVVLDIRPPAPALGVPAGSSPVRVSPNPAEQARIRLWQHLAPRYANRSERLLFEIRGGPDWTAAPLQAKAGLSRLLSLIRKTNPKRVLVIGWDNPIGLVQLPLPDDRDLIVAVTNEEPYRFTHQGVPGLRGSNQWLGTGCCNPREIQLMTIPLDLASAWSAAHRYPVWLCGFQSYKDVPMALRGRHARLMRDAAEARGISWAYGDFSGDFGVYDGAALAWQVPMLDALLGA